MKKVRMQQENEVNRTIDGDTAEGQMIVSRQIAKVAEKKTQKATEAPLKAAGSAEGHMHVRAN